MGYHTDFSGRFTLNKPLARAHADYLQAFCDTRRMMRDPELAGALPDPVRVEVGLPIGDQGGYFVGGGGSFGQDKDASIIDFNREPKGQPALWCQWVPTEDRLGIEWNGTEKFYAYTEWLQYLCDHFLGPWGYVLTGEVAYQGEDSSDRGTVLCAHEGGKHRVSRLARSKRR